MWLHLGGGEVVFCCCEILFCAKSHGKASLFGILAFGITFQSGTCAGISSEVFAEGDICLRSIDVSCGMTQLGGCIRG